MFASSTSRPTKLPWRHTSMRSITKTGVANLFHASYPEPDSWSETRGSETSRQHYPHVLTHAAQGYTIGA